MQITLISPRIAVQKGDFLGSGVPYWPLELAILAAFLRDLGHDVQMIDLFGAAPNRLRLSGDHFLQGDRIESFVSEPSVLTADAILVFALSAMSHAEVLRIVQTLRLGLPRTPIAIFENSQAVTAYALPRVADDFFAAGASALLCGEVYGNWGSIEAFLCGRGEPPENVVTPSERNGRPRRQSARLMRYPIPAWDLVNVEAYWKLPYSHGPKTKRFFPILTSRGCPYPCDFCVVPETNNRKWRGREPADVVDEMIALRDRFGVRDFQIEDLNPTVSGERWDKIAKLLIERAVNIRYYFVSGTKAETVKVAKVPDYAASGCRYVSISPESGSPRILREIGKPFEHDHALALVRACAANGIRTQACFIVGHPAETENDHRLSCDYLRALVREGLDEVAVFGVSPLPGSAIHSQGRLSVAPGRLWSFTPTGRSDFEMIARRRRELIRIFFGEKLLKGTTLWRQGIRSILGWPETKMENLPRRAAFVLGAVAATQLRQLFLSSVGRARGRDDNG